MWILGSLVYSLDHRWSLMIIIIIFIIIIIIIIIIIYEDRKHKQYHPSGHFCWYPWFKKAMIELLNFIHTDKDSAFQCQKGII